MTFRWNARVLLAIVPILSVAAALHAQTAEPVEKYPSRSIRIVVPYTPGGQTDAYARLIAQRFQTAWGQTVIVDNRPGANGVIGTDFVIRAPADGYTLLFTANSAHTLGPLLKNPPPFQSVADFTPIAAAVTYPMYVLVNQYIPVKNVPELVEYARKKNDALTYSSTGAGSAGHISCELFGDATGIKMRHIPYRGSAPAQMALIAGDVDMFCDSVGNSQKLVNEGKMRGLVITAQQRLTAAPDIPTTQELGMPSVEVEVWLGLLGPKSMPAPIAAKLNAEVRKLMQSDEIIRRTAAEGTRPTNLNTAEFVQFIQADQARYGKVIRDKKIRIED
jgi:tripartite-type tricarboxylate transporter receptor subunit TctC